jgi:four helix bundle protein
MNQDPNKKPDLLERTAVFGEGVIDFCRVVKIDNITGPLVNQLIRSGTSIGANYAEANNVSSRKDFRNKIFICKKEAEDTKYWLRLIKKVLNENLNIDYLSRECQELVMIFQKIVSSLNK